MKKILITEFMNPESVKALKKKFRVDYDKSLWKNEKKIANIIQNT